MLQGHSTHCTHGCLLDNSPSWNVRYCLAYINSHSTTKLHNRNRMIMYTQVRIILPFGSFIMSPPMSSVEDYEVRIFIFVSRPSNYIQSKCFLSRPIFVCDFPFLNQERRYKELYCAFIILWIITTRWQKKTHKLRYRRW